MPGASESIVKAIEKLDKLVKKASAGDLVTITLTGIDLNQVSIGHVLCPPNAVVPIVQRFKAQIVIFDIKVPMIPGYTVIFHQQALNAPATLKTLLAVVKSTGEVIKNKPKALTKQTTAMVEVEITDARGICLERFKDAKELGRFTLRKGGDTLAAGIVLDLLP